MAPLSMTDDIPLPFTKPNCPKKCGNVNILYPFGISKGCYLNPSYEIICNSSFHPSKPFLKSLNIEVELISFKYDKYLGLRSNVKDFQTITVKMPVEKTCGLQNTNITSIDLRGTPYIFSNTANVFIVEGCASSAILSNRRNVVQGGCSSLCDRDEFGLDSEQVVSSCVGVGCCKINTSEINNDGFEFYQLNVYNEPTKLHNCTSTMLVDQTYNYTSGTNKLVQLSTVPTVLDWMVNSSTGITLPSDDKDTRNCERYNYNYSSTVEGFLCYCTRGYFGNPYIPHGCQGNIKALSPCPFLPFSFANMDEIDHNRYFLF